MKNTYDYDRHSVYVEELNTGALLIEERTSGPSTRYVYDSNSHTHQVIIPLKSREYLAALMNTSVLAVRSAVEGFFTNYDRYLADFLDMLDRRKIVYTYYPNIGEVIEFTPDKAS